MNGLHFNILHMVWFYEWFAFQYFMLKTICVTTIPLYLSLCVTILLDIDDNWSLKYKTDSKQIVQIDRLFLCCFSVGLSLRLSCFCTIDYTNLFQLQIHITYFIFSFIIYYNLFHLKLHNILQLIWTSNS